VKEFCTILYAGKVKQIEEELILVYDLTATDGKPCVGTGDSYPEDGNNRFLKKAPIFLPDYMMSHLKTINLSLFLIKHHTMNTYGGVDVIARGFKSISALWGWLVSFTP
jgi:hypothetical protein